VFGDGQAILAGSAMLTAAMQVLVDVGPAGHRALPCLLTTTQALIGGQSQDLHLEQRETVTLDDVLSMEAGKTAALLSCSAAIGAVLVGSAEPVVEGLMDFGYELGLAFQLVDDYLGIAGDSASTGKSSSSDIRAGKRSAPIVAALSAGTPASPRLAELLHGGPPDRDEDVALAAELVGEAGGLEWAVREADTRLATALGHLERLDLADAARAELVALARFIVARDR
jgi:geranylgeranyl diphosphate synthase type I